MSPVPHGAAELAELCSRMALCASTPHRPSMVAELLGLTLNALQRSGGKLSIETPFGPVTSIASPDGSTLRHWRFPLLHEGGDLGEVVIDDLEHRDMAPEEERLATALAGLLAHLVTLTSRSDAAEIRSSHLATALESRVVIEQAKGLLAERLKLPPDHAFDDLRARARQQRRNIHSVAQELLDEVTTGESAERVTDPRNPSQP